MMMKDPVRTPALPSPCTALPTIKTAELGETPQMRLPSSKMANEMRKVVFVSNVVKMRP